MPRSSGGKKRPTKRAATQQPLEPEDIQALAPNETRRPSGSSLGQSR
jgi:hypothetical protein